MPTVHPDGGTPPLNSWDTYAPSTTPSSTSSSSSSNPKDIWGLGKLYGQPVLVGTTTEGGPTTPGSGPMQAELGAGGETTSADQFAPTQALVKQAMQWYMNDPANYRALQQQLAAAGYYGSSAKYVPGRLDTATRSALKSALDDYEAARQSGNPVTISEFLQQQAVSTQKAADAAAKAQPQKQVVLTDPTAIRAAAQAAFENALGRSATEKELNTFVQQFQANQKSTQLSTNAQVSSPDLSTDALAYAEQSSPTEYGQHNAESLKGALLNMFLPSESQLPNSTPVPAA